MRGLCGISDLGLFFGAMTERDRGRGRERESRRRRRRNYTKNCNINYAEREKYILVQNEFL